MDETPECARVGPLLAELATGAATGYERARALDHVADCSSCAAELAELSRVADGLLLLAPLHEPPAGFETSVLRRLELMPTRPARRTVRSWTGRGWRWPGGVRLVAAAAAMGLAVAGGVALESRLTADDRRMANEYRHVLAQPTSLAPVSAVMTTDSGLAVGRVYLYAGSPPWVMVAITAAPESGTYAMDVVTVDGLRYPAGTCQVTGTTGVVGYPLPVPIAAIASIELTRPGLRLTFHQP